MKRKVMLFLAAIFMFVLGYSQTTTVWNPAGNATGTGLWSEAANWTNGLPDGNFKVVFNVPGAEDCKLDDTRSITRLVMGDGNIGETLRIQSGGDLSIGSGSWSAVGYNNTATLVAETGGTITFGNHMWVGFNSGAEGSLYLSGGTVNVDGMTGFGWNGGVGHAYINSGVLNCAQWNSTSSISASSTIDLAGGLIKITGNYVTSINDYVTSGNITGYGGSGTVDATYDSGTNITTVEGVPETIPPTVVSTDPDDGATLVPLTYDFVVDFSEAMNEANTEGAITISPDIADKAYTWNGSELTITGTQAASTSYTITIGTGATDLSGNALASAYNFSFTTSDGSATTTVWNPAANASGTGLWSEAGNWTNGLPDGDYKVIFNVTDADTCKLNDSRYATQLVMGSNGPGEELLVQNGGELNLGSGTWSSVGYNDVATMIVETGGVVNFGSHMWVGLNSGGDGTIKLDGGTVNVSAMTGLGWSGGTGTIYLYSGELNCAQWNATSSMSAGSLIDIEEGQMNITGDKQTSINDYVTSGNIVGYGGTGTVNVSYDSGSGTTIVTANPETTPPTVSSVTPADASTDVAITSDIVIEFSELMDNASVESAFSVSPDITNKVFSWTDETLTVSGDDMSNGTEYTVTITTSATDVVGNNMASDYTFSFTTISAATPTVVSTDPANGAVNVMPNKVVAINFSTEMSTSTVENAISVSPATTPTFSWDGNTVNVDCGTMSLNTEYTIMVGTGAQSSSGVNMTSEHQFAFTIIEETDPPSIVSNYPDDGATVVPTSFDMVIGFSEAMNTTNVESAITIAPDIADKAFSWSGNEATITGTKAAGTTYTITVGTGATDDVGNALESEFSYSYTTSSGTVTTVWNPAGNASSTGLWSEAGNWTNGLPDGDYKVVFNVPDADTCELEDSRYITSLVMGDGDLGEVLRIGNGGELNTSEDWSAIGYNNAATLMVETGGTANFGLHLWVGQNSGGLGTVYVNGGTLNIAAQTGIGWSGGVGEVYVNSGTLNCTNFNKIDHASPSITEGSSIDITGGTMYVNGNRTADMQAYVDAGRIEGYAGTGTVNISYDSDLNKTVITADPEAVPPTVLSAAPANASVDVAINSDIVIEFSELMDNSTVESAFSVSPDITNKVFSWTGETLTVSGDDMSNSQEYTVTIGTGAADLVGNTLESAYTFSFTTVDPTAPPTIVGVTPTDGSTNIKLDSVITIQFSKAMKTATVESAIIVDNSANTAFSWDAETVTITVDNFQVNTEYTVTVGTGAQATDDSFLASEYVFSFTTIEEVDPPTIVSTTPAGGATNVALDAAIVMEFSETMDQSSVENALTITPAIAALNYSWSSQTLTISGANKAEDTEYTVTLGTGATDALGNHLASAYTFSFTSYPGTQDIVWDPAANASGTGLWSEAANWSLGVVPDGDFKAILNMDGAEECKLDGSYSVAQLVTGSQGGGNNLRVLNGGELTTTETVWSGIAQSDTGKLIVEEGGKLSFASHLWIGYSTDAMGIVELNGGTINVGAAFGLGFDGGTGLFYLNSGTLNLKQWNETGSIKGSSVMDISEGSLKIKGDVTTKINNNVSSNKIIAYNGLGDVVVSYDAGIDSTLVTGYIETTPPTVVSMSPANATNEVAVNTVISIEFSELMNNASVEQALTIQPDITNKTYTWDGVTLTVSGDDLNLITDYTVSIATSATDLVGNAMESQFTATFTTVNEQIPPTVENYSPTNGTSDIALDTDITIGFSEMMDMASVESALTITPLLANQSMSWSGNTITISGTKSYMTTYQVDLATSATDTAGNALESAMQFSFTTMNEQTPPDVLSYSPQNNASEVPVNSEIKVEFSELMDESNVATALTVQPAISNMVLSWEGNWLTVSGDDMAYETMYTVELSQAATDTAGNQLTSALSFSFTTASELTPPTVVEVTPNNGSTGVAVDTDISIKFSKKMKQAEAEAAIAVVPDLQNKTFTWDNYTVTISSDSLMLNQNYTVSIATAAVDSFDIPLENEYSFSFTTIEEITPPKVVTTVPADGDQQVDYRNDVVITFSESMNTESVEAALSITPQMSNVSFAWSQVSSTLTIAGDDLLPNTAYALLIENTATDIPGNTLEENYAMNFTTIEQLLAPEVSSTSPVNGANGVALDAALVVEFTEPMNTTSVENAITISPQLENTVYAWNANTLTITSDNLSLFTEYTVEIGTGAQSNYGLAMAEPYVFTFKTENEKVPPTIVSNSPINGSTDVATGSNIIIAFSEPMDEASVESAVLVTPEISNQVYNWDASSATLTLTGDAMEVLTTYIITITGEATDIAGNNIENEYSFSFVTENEKIAPDVMTSLPGDGATDVALNADIVIEFSEPMDEASVESALSVSPEISNMVYNWNSSSKTLTLTGDDKEVLTTYTITIIVEATDTAGNNIENEYSFSFETENEKIAPEVMTSLPGDGATDVALNANIVIEFSEPMDEASVESALTVTPEISNMLHGWSSSSTKLTLSGNTMKALTTYTVKLTTNANDTAGNNLENTYSFSFETENETIAPEVISVVPEDSAIDVALNTNIVIEFSELMNQVSVDTNLNIVPELNNVVHTWNDNQLIISADAFEYNTTYTVTIDSLAADTAGNTLVNDYSFGFTTVGDTVLPVVLHVIPADSAVDVALDQSISIQFSELMDEASVEENISIIPEIGNLNFIWMDSTLTITGDSMAFITEYTVIVGANSKDLQGNEMDADFIFSFKTENETIPPYVVSVYPGNEATGIAVEDTIRIAFSERMDQGSVEEAITISPARGNLVYTWSDSVLMITGDPMEFYTMYTVTIGNGAKDTVGNSLESAFESSFTTVQVDNISSNSVQTLRVYPNPATDYFQFDFNGIIERLEILNVAGGVQYMKTNLNCIDNLRINVSDYSQGIYILKIDSNGEVYRNLIIIE